MCAKAVTGIWKNLVLAIQIPFDPEDQMSFDLDIPIEELHESVQNNPLDLDLWITLINRVAAEESAEDALEEIFVAEDLFPENNDLCALKALCLTQLGETWEAHELIQASLRRSPGSEMVDRILADYLPNFRGLTQDMLFNPFLLKDRLQSKGFDRNPLERIESTINLIQAFNDEERNSHHLIDVLERHVENFPDDINARLDVARLCLNLDERARSRKHYRHVLDSDPLCASAYFELATIEPDLDEAISLSESGLDLSPRFECGRYNYAGLLLQSGMLKEGRNEMLRLPADSPYYLPGLEAIAKSYCEEGTFEEAIRFQKKVCILSPNNPEAWNNYGHFFASLGDWANAIEHFDRAIRIDCEHVDALHNRAQMLGKLNRNEEAVHVLRYALTIEPQNEALIVSLAVGLGNSNRVDEAISVLQDALLLFPDHSQMWVNLGSLQFRNGNLDKAMNCSRRAIKLDSDEGLAWWNIAAVYALRNQRDECLAALDSAIEKLPELRDLVRKEDVFKDVIGGENFPF